MNFFRHSASFLFGTAALALLLAAPKATAQNLQSVSNYSRTHEALLASQQRIQDQIRLEETQRYANHLYEETEPEPDIYTEGWGSTHVNSYKNAVIPNTKVIDVRNYHIPVPGYVTSPYGYRPRFHRMHKGIDLKLNIGDTVRAAFTGRVRLTRFERGGYGFYVVLRHENGLETVYGHLSRFLVHPDQYVRAGQPIALGGNTGGSTGPHLHFETRFMGVAINPAAIFDFRNQVTHTDYFTFDKRTYDQARDYSPSERIAAARESHAAAESSVGSSTSTYTVKNGDNLGRIASQHGMSLTELCSLNGFTRYAHIHPGDVLKVK